MKQFDKSPLPAIDSKNTTRSKYLVAKCMNNQETRNSRVGSSNLFDEVVNLEYNMDKGPKYSNKGEIIRHSILGKQDWFNKIKNGKKPQFEEHVLRQMQLPKSQIRLMEDQKSMARSDYRSVKISSSGKIKKDKRDQLTTKNQLMEELDRIDMRIATNRKTECNKTEDLQATLRRVVTKEERVQTKHCQTEREWNNFIEKQAALLNREPVASQLIQAESHRTKLEAASAFEALKTDYELFGPRVWQMTLRKPDIQPFTKLKLKHEEVIVENEIKYDFIMGSDLPNAFTESSICGHKGGIEYIRKPNIYYDGNADLSISQLPFKSFRSDEYLLKRIQKQQDQFEKSLMMSIIKTGDYDQLVVIGRSQLDIERQMLLNDGQDMTAAYRKELIKPVMEHDNDKEEIFDMNYSGTQRLILPPIRKLRKQDSLQHSDDSRNSQELMNDIDRSQIQ